MNILGEETPTQDVISDHVINEGWSVRSVGYKGMLNEDDESFNNLQNNEERMREEAESKGGEKSN